MESSQPTPPPQVAVDPNLATEQTQAQQALVAGLQTQASGDTAALMSRYGTMMALSGTGVAPMAGAGSSAPIAGR